jgi:hypothetical protein
MSPSMVHRYRDVQGESARAAVFGVSDGLVSNVALILGFAGASTDPSLVRLAGIVVADVAIGDLAVDAIAGGVLLKNTRLRSVSPPTVSGVRSGSVIGCRKLVWTRFGRTQTE